MHRNLRFFLVTISFHIIDLCTGCEIYGSRLFCNGTFNTLINGVSRNVTAIEIHHLNATHLHLSDIARRFPDLKSLTVKFSQIKQIHAKNVRQHDNLEVVSINDASIGEVNEIVFGKFRNLRVLDLRNNSLRLMHGDRIEHLKHISAIYLSGNKWNCSKNLDWAYYSSNESSIKDLQTLTCHDEPFEGKPLLYVAKVLHRAQEQCPSSCLCSLINVFRNSDTDELQPVVEVDCAGANFTALPDFLPEHAKILKMHGNLISDLWPLRTNHVYREVTDLYLDHNAIESIDLLEGSYWLKNFRVLSLKGNKLSELPTYAIDNALQQNPNMPNAIMLYFGDNPWRCDCIFTPSFQEDILVKYESQIQDMLDIKCSYNEADENSLATIVHLSRSSICQLPGEYTIQALDMLNGVLASLIVLVLGKLAYDYYYFKRTGKLPWIVTKMP